MPLRLIGVTKRYGPQAALDRASIEVPDGAIYGFIGHNGAGKTTAMRIALSLVRPDEGRVLVDGFDARLHPREARARMGGLIETPGFHPTWSGAKNLSELARLQGLARADAEHEAGLWMERVGLAKAGAKPVGAYSHGMRQRLGIAAALLGSPPYVLLDEPTNGLDPEGIVEVRELLRRESRERGTTFLVSSHQLHELSALCTRVGVLKGGRVVAEAATGNLLAAHGRYRLEARDPDAARRVLAELGAGASADGGAAGDGALAVDVGDRAPEDVLSRLVAGGAGVRAFAPAAHGLEEIYLRFPPAAARTSDGGPVPAAEPATPRAPPHPVACAFGAEVRRFASAAAVPLLLAAPALAGAVAIARRASQASRDQESVGASTVFSATDVNGFEAVGLALQAGLPVLAFILLGLGSQSVAAELARGTLRNALLRPVTRGDLVLAKLLALSAAGLTSYLLLAGVAAAIAAAAFGFGDVVEVLPNGATFTLVPADALRPDLVRALLAPLAPLACYTALGFVSGTLARTGATALALALGLGALLDVLRGVMRAFGATSALPSDHLPSPLSDTSFVRFYVDVSQGVSNATFEHGSASIWVPLAWGLSAALVARAIVVRRDVA